MSKTLDRFGCLHVVASMRDRSLARTPPLFVLGAQCKYPIDPVRNQLMCTPPRLVQDKHPEQLQPLVVNPKKQQQQQEEQLQHAFAQSNKGGRQSWWFTTPQLNPGQSFVVPNSCPADASMPGTLAADHADTQPTHPPSQPSVRPPPHYSILFYSIPARLPRRRACRDII